MKKYLFLSLSLLFLSFSFNAKAQTLEPLYDAYLQNGVRYNNEVLRVENSPTRVRETYLMFDLTSITGAITNIQLELTVYTDPGTGTINLYKGLSDNWTETNLSNTNKPAKGILLGSITGTHSEGNVKIVDIAPNTVSGNFLSLVLAHTTASDVAFASKGPETTHILTQGPDTIWPRLVVTANSAPTDTTPPSITAFQTTFKTETAIDLDWSATDNVGITGYTLTIDGAAAGLSSPTATSHSFTGLTENTTYAFVLTAVDAASNTSAASNLSETTLQASSGGGGSNGGSGLWAQSASDIHYTTGKVGIGTTAPDEALTVKGTVHAEKVVVDLNVPAPDYVFLEDYKLMTLEEIQKHIDKHGHLPNIPSAKKMEAEGVELGTMNMKLLEKIEELTLYILEQEKRISELEKR